MISALANAALLLPIGFPAVLATRFLTGFFLAGVYPPAMKMIATWFRAFRGLAIGVLVSMFSAVVVTRTLLRLMIHTERGRRIEYYHVER